VSHGMLNIVLAIYLGNEMEITWWDWKDEVFTYGIWRRRFIIIKHVIVSLETL